MAINLVNSMRVNVIAKPNFFAQDLNIQPLSYKDAVKLLLKKLNKIWHLTVEKILLLYQTQTSNGWAKEKYQHMVLQILKWRELKPENIEKIIHNIWSIGGAKGWYYGNRLWKVRGLMDKFVRALLAKSPL